MNNENLLLDKNEEEFVFDFNTVLAKLFIYWKWLAVSVVICLCLAFFYIQKQAPVYRIQQGRRIRNSTPRPASVPELCYPIQPPFF